MAAGRVEVARDSFITCGAFQQSEAHDLRCAQRHAVLPAERASSALRCARRCAVEAVGPRMYHLYHLHVHVRDSRKSVERDTVDASSACLCDVYINARVIFW